MLTIRATTGRLRRRIRGRLRFIMNIVVQYISWRVGRYPSCNACQKRPYRYRLTYEKSLGHFMRGKEPILCHACLREWESYRIDNVGQA